MNDSEGYRLLEKEFTSRGYNFKWIENLKDGWKIYQKTSVRTGESKWELIRPIKNEETNFGGNLSPKRWSYPGDAAFGKLGFDCISLARAREVHANIIADKTIKTEPQNIKLQAPKNKVFTITDLCDLNPELSRTEIYAKINDLMAKKQVACLGQSKEKGKGKKPYLYKLL